MKLDEMDLGPHWRARLVANEPLTPAGAQDEVRELQLELDTPGFEFLIGQSVAVLIAGPLDFGQQHHVRLYSIASTPMELGPGRISLCVLRCSYIDPYSGERYPGTASNYLCDLAEGSELLLAGPVGLPFEVPADDTSPLIMIGLGTGFAPLRALLRHIYEERGGWSGRVLLFHGARTGLEIVYRDLVAGLASEPEGIEAVEVVSPRPAWGEPADIASALERHRSELWGLLEGLTTHVYVAGRAAVAAELDHVLSAPAGGADAWSAHKEKMAADGRWMELLY